jgi:hypothetical protein
MLSDRNACLCFWTKNDIEMSEQSRRDVVSMGNSHRSNKCHSKSFVERKSVEIIPTFVIQKLVKYELKTYLTYEPVEQIQEVVGPHKFGEKARSSCPAAPQASQNWSVPNLFQQIFLT